MAKKKKVTFKINNNIQEVSEDLKPTSTVLSAEKKTDSVDVSETFRVNTKSSDRVWPHYMRRFFLAVGNQGV